MTIKAFTFLFFIISLISFNTFSQTPSSHYQFWTDLKRQKIKGKVASVAETEYNATGDSMVLKAITKYDEGGNKTSFITYSPSDELLSKTTFSYNDSGRLKEEKRYKADGTLAVRTTCAYDDRGNKIEEYNYDVSGTMFLKIMSKYDGKGNRLVRDSYNEFGALFLKCNSKYNEDGYEVSSKEYDSHKSLQYSTTYDYEDFDSNGNWQKRTTYRNATPSLVTTRQIEYR